MSDLPTAADLDRLSVPVVERFLDDFARERLARGAHAASFIRIESYGMVSAGLAVLQNELGPEAVRALLTRLMADCDSRAALSRTRIRRQSTIRAGARS